jgi:ligand-binding sensor domain-containing protein
MKKFATVIALALCLFVVSSESRAQVKSTLSPDWATYSFSTTPECMIADGNFLWIGTDGGLVHFDKRDGSFDNYYSSNSGLPINGITHLTRGKDGTIWIGTRGGGAASVLAGVWFTYTPKNSPLPGYFIYSIAADSAGRIWFGTAGGLAVLDQGKWTIYTTSNSPILSNVIYGLAADRSGNIWISTDYAPKTAGKADLLKFDGGTNWELHNATTDAGFFTT